MKIGRTLNQAFNKFSKKYQIQGSLNKVINQKNVSLIFTLQYIQFKYFATIFFVFKSYKIYHLQLERSIFLDVLETLKSEENQIISFLKEGKIYEEGFLETKVRN